MTVRTLTGDTVNKFIKHSEGVWKREKVPILEGNTSAVLTCLIH